MITRPNKWALLLLIELTQNNFDVSLILGQKALSLSLNLGQYGQANDAGKNLKCDNLLIITADQYDEIITDDGKTINVIPAWRWILNK